MWALTLWQSAPAPLQWGVVVGASLAAAWADARWRRIPNALTLPLLAAGLLAALVWGGPRGLGDSVAASLLLALPYTFLFIQGHGGGGDVKLMAAVGAWLGMVNGLFALAVVALSGVALAIVWVIVHRPARVDRVPALPFGVAIGIGVCISATTMLLWRM